MSVFEVRVEGDARVMVFGELDMATAPQLTSTIDSVATTTPRVVVDLGAVSFMDSSGIGALCLAQSKLEAEGGVLVLGRVSTQVQSVLQMAGLESEFVRESSGT